MPSASEKKRKGRGEDRYSNLGEKRGVHSLRRERQTRSRLFDLGRKERAHYHSAERGVSYYYEGSRGQNREKGKSLEPQVEKVVAA